MKLLSRKLIFSLAVVSALCACSDDDDNGAPPVSTETTQSQPVVSNGPLSSDAGGSEDAAVAEVESQLPPISALDTFGGQLLAGYLQGTLSGEEVVAQTFDDDDYVMSNLAEMSMAVGQLKEEDNYNEEKREKVLVLEGAMTQFLNERIRTHKHLEDAIEYGTAVGLGVVGGVYSNEVMNGLRYIGRSPVIQGPKNAIVSVYQNAKGGAAKVGTWLSAQGSKALNTKGVAGTVNKSSELYRRSVAYFATRNGTVTGKELVLRNVTRIYGSPELAKGVKVLDVPEEELAGIKRMVFHKTGISGLYLHQTKGDARFIARQIKSGGTYEYFYVEGTGVKALTKNGEEIIVPPSVMAAMTANRLRNFGSRSVQFVTSSGKKIKTGVTNSRAYQYVTTNPQARRVIQGTAVGGTIGGLTLLALRPIDTRYLTLEDYVKDLEAEGVHIEDFLDTQRNLAQTQAGVY